MMSGSRGESPDSFASLLQIVGDPKATAERIKQLEAATKENYATLADLQKTRADLDTKRRR